MYKKKTPKGETSIEIPTAKKKAPHFMIDTNKDGVISEAEKKTWIKKKELKHYDLNKDGKVTDKEREETQRKLKDKRATREKKKEEVAKKVEESRERIDPIKYLQEKLANTKDSEKRKRINDKIKKYKAKKK